MRFWRRTAILAAVFAVSIAGCGQPGDDSGESTEICSEDEYFFGGQCRAIECEADEDCYGDHAHCYKNECQPCQQGTGCDDAETCISVEFEIGTDRRKNWHCVPVCGGRDPGTGEPITDILPCQRWCEDSPDFDPSWCRLADCSEEPSWGEEEVIYCDPSVPYRSDPEVYRVNDPDED